MFVIVVIAASILIALARGGRVTNLSRLSLRYFGLLFVPLLLQIVAFSPLGDVPLFEAPLAQYLYVTSLGLGVIVLWLNRHLPGVGWIALGLLLNFIVISLNGGFMPMSAQARAFAGIKPLTGRANNVVPMTDSTVLPWLADILPLPPFVPLAHVFSIGDVLILIGGVIFTQSSLVLPKKKFVN